MARFFAAVMVGSPPESRSQIRLADVGEQHSQRRHSPACLKGLVVDVPAAFQRESIRALDVMSHGAAVRAKDRLGVSPEDGTGEFRDEAVDRDEISRQVVLPEPGTEHMLIGRPAAIRKASGLHSVCRSPAAEGNKGPVFAPLL